MVRGRRCVAFDSRFLSSAHFWQLPWRSIRPSPGVVAGMVAVVTAVGFTVVVAVFTAVVVFAVVVVVFVAVDSRRRFSRRRIPGRRISCPRACRTKVVQRTHGEDFAVAMSCVPHSGRASGGKTSPGLGASCRVELRLER